MSQQKPQFNIQYTAYVAASIDGRISLSRNHPPDWTSKEDWIFFQKSLSKADAVVVGRNTYEAVADRLDKRKTFVLTSRVRSVARRGSVSFINPAKVDLSPLLQKFKTVAIVGGGPVYRYMLEKRLLDELYVTVEPLIFGRGKAMFIGGSRTTKAKLISARKLNGQGTILLHYRILHSST